MILALPPNMLFWAGDFAGLIFDFLIALLYQPKIKEISQEGQLLKTGQTLEPLPQLSPIKKLWKSYKLFIQYQTLLLYWLSHLMQENKNQNQVTN